MGLACLLAFSTLLAGCSPGSQGDPGEGDFTAGASPKAEAKDKDGRIRFRAVTFNLYNRPWERAARIENAKLLLESLDADVIFLQEVAMGWILPGGDPARGLAEKLKMRYVRFWHERNWGIFKTGLAVLSRFPIAEAEYHEFRKHQFWDAKGYLRARLDLPGGGRLQLVNLHMASTADDAIRDSEWQELAAFVDQLREHGPVLIGGDFNTLPAHPALAEFVRRTGARNLYDGWANLERMRTWTPSYRDPIGAGQFGPRAELIDYFFAAPSVQGASGARESRGTLQFAGGRIVHPEYAPRPSDHLPVVAELEFSPL